MANNPDQSSPSSPQKTQEPQGSGSVGEFTQIFSSGTVPQPQSEPGRPLAFASPDDEFARFFAGSPTPPQAPAPTNHSSESTLIFEAISATPPGVPVDAPALPVRRADSPQEVPVQAAQPSSSEFTRIFSSIDPPAAPAPDLQPVSKPSLGEFTQFFSAISARENAAAPNPVEPPKPVESPRPTPVASPMPLSLAEGAGPAKSVEGAFTQLFQSPPVASGPDAPPAFPRQASAGSEKIQVPPRTTPPQEDATVIFQQMPKLPQQGGRTTPANATAAAASDASSFTQIFQQIPTPGPNAGSMPVPQPEQRPAQAQVSQAIAAPAQSSPGNGPVSDWPAFGPPPQPGGSFTDVFQSQRPQSATVPASKPSQPGATTPPAAQGGGFTELFQTAPAPPQQAAASPFSNFGTAPSQGTVGWPSPSSGGSAPAPSAGWPVASPSAAPPLASAGGEFTRLMQSLNPAGSGAANPAIANDSFFPPPPNIPSNSSQESEFTRVLRGSAQRDAGAQPVKAPGPAAVKAGPGMALEPSQAKQAEAGPPKKSKTLVILLVVMNAVLLIALLVIAILVLRRK